MTVVGWRQVQQFSLRYSDSRKPLEAWRGICDQVSWKTPIEVKDSFPDMDTVGRCYVFNILRNRYRLIVSIIFAADLIQVKNILTHAEYDRGTWKNGC